MKYPPPSVSKHNFDFLYFSIFSRFFHSRLRSKRKIGTGYPSSACHFSNHFYIKLKILSLLSFKKFVLNCRCQAGLKRSRQFESCFLKNRSKRSYKIQILREVRKILNIVTKKAQGLLNLCFLRFVAFSCYKDGGGNRTRTCDLTDVNRVL